MPEETIQVRGTSVPVVCANTVIVGAGAAGMNCAVQLVRFWRAKGVCDPRDRLLVVTGDLALGASRMSGSDKQTYYKMGTSPRVPDTAEDFARTLTAFGCCHGDTALVEGVCSLRGFYNLVEAGVPFPHDSTGAFVGYKTDHDPYERATSAGPKTSKFMSACLQDEVERMGVRIIDKHPVIEFITAGKGDERRIVGMLCFDGQPRREREPDVRFFVANNWVLAAGGPGGIYAASVYPAGQTGIHGAAFLAGLEACNLTESQYGLASLKFRWNVSGTYMQVIPRIYSTDAGGRDEREFLTEYFGDMAAMATNIFLKGYQWPFDAQRIAGRKSSLIDMAVHQETVVRGRRVWMDFRSNPVGPTDRDEFRLRELGDEAILYLEKTGAIQATPIERLRHMNPLAVEIYAENGIDLTTEPLEIAVCAQHHNGGFSVGKWWESSVRRTFVIGEMAGTHGVKRPGGSALNAGQVGAARAAEYIANVYGADLPDLKGAAGALSAGLASAMGRIEDLRAKASSAPVTSRQAMDEIRRRMTRFGAHLRWRAGTEAALAEAVRQYRALWERGMRFARPSELPEAVTTIQQCLTHVAMLKAICGMLQRGAGSRGSHCVLEEGAVEMHPSLIDPATDRPYCFKPENESLRNVIQTTRYNPDAPDLFDLGEIAPRPIPVLAEAFEPAWAAFRDGRIYET